MTQKLSKHVQHFMMTEAMMDDVLAYQKLHKITYVLATIRELIQRGLNCPANLADHNMP